VPLKPATKPAPGATTVATLEPPAAAAAPDGAERAQIARIAALYRRQPGSVRVIAYAASPPPGSDPLATYQAALDRAQAVARDLAAAGIPPGKITTQAAPATGARRAGRVDIQFADDVKP